MKTKRHYEVGILPAHIYLDQVKDFLDQKEIS